MPYASLPTTPPIVVVIPLYTTALCRNALRSLQRTLTVLARHPVVIACPRSLDLTPLAALIDGVDIRRFDDAWFDGIDGYNRLMLSPSFYDAFADYDYLLICQTDVFVFEDRLDEWIGRGYDYVGAPWIASPQNALTRLAYRISDRFGKRRRNTARFFKVGNGGFSLRRVATMRELVSTHQADIARRLAQPDDLDHHVEDVWFSLIAPTLAPMRIPGYVEAVDFCIDRKPRIALRLNGGRLPFACHRYYDRNNGKFWAPIVARYTQPTVSNEPVAGVSYATESLFFHLP
jgi:hypothetical protein